MSMDQEMTYNSKGPIRILKNKVLVPKKMTLTKKGSFSKNLKGILLKGNTFDTPRSDIDLLFLKPKLPWLTLEDSDVKKEFNFQMVQNCRTENRSSALLIFLLRIVNLITNGFTSEKELSPNRYWLIAINTAECFLAFALLFVQAFASSQKTLKGYIIFFMGFLSFGLGMEIFELGTTKVVVSRIADICLVGLVLMDSSYFEFSNIVGIHFLSLLIWSMLVFFGSNLMNSWHFSFFLIINLVITSTFYGFHKHKEKIDTFNKKRALEMKKYEHENLLMHFLPVHVITNIFKGKIK